MWDKGFKEVLSGKTYLRGTLKEKNGERLRDYTKRRKKMVEYIIVVNIYWMLTVCQSCTLILSVICATALQGSNFHLYFTKG